MQNRASIGGEAQQKTYDTESSLINDKLGLLNENSFHEQMLEQNKIKGANDSIIHALMNKRQGSSEKLRPRSSKGIRNQGTLSNSKMPVIDQASQHPKNAQTKSEERTKSSQATRNLSSQKQKREAKDRFSKMVQ